MSKPEQGWQVILHREPDRVLSRLPRQLVKRIWAKIQELKKDPRPNGCVKIRGTQYDSLYRLRVGDWRISYAIENDQLIVLVLEIAPRGDAYRKF